MPERKYHAQPSSLLKVLYYIHFNHNISRQNIFIANLCYSLLTELPVKWIKELDEETSPLKGQPLYMTCELNKERDVVWKRSGKILKLKTGKISINVIGLGHAVTVQNTTEEDAGLYTCEVANQPDVMTSTNVKVIGE